MAGTFELAESVGGHKGALCAVSHRPFVASLEGPNAGAMFAFIPPPLRLDCQLSFAWYRLSSRVATLRKRPNSSKMGGVGSPTLTSTRCLAASV